MSSIKKNKKKTKKKNIEVPDVTMYQSVPEDIKMLFGKFYVYSLLYIVFFGILYPVFLMYYLNNIFSILLIIVLVLLYGYIVYDIKKKTGKYISNIFFFLVALVVLTISLSIIKLMF